MRTFVLPRRRAFAVTAAGLTAMAFATASAAEESAAYVVDVSDVTVKVGEPAVMLATLRVRDGYRILSAYNNRVIRLSSYDDGIVFEQDMVPAKVEDRALVFPVGLRATKPGTHPINGLLRVGYIHGTDEMAMVSMRLIANVTATE
nr:hypothetical protein [uncultured Rhodopila sp.]